MRRNWNSVDGYVIGNLGKMKKSDIAVSLGATPDNLSHRLRRLGLAEQRQKVNLLECRDYFIMNVANKTQARMAIELGVSVRTIARCMSALRL